VNEIDVRLDRARLKLFPLGGPDTEVPVGYSATEYAPDSGLEVRFRSTAGLHTIGISFNKDAWEMEGIGPGRLPVTSGGFFGARDTTLTAGRIEMGVQKVDILGPFDGKVPIQSDARRRLFICYPSNPAEEEACARRILSRIARLAYRRPVTDDDVRTVMGVYKMGRADKNFDSGIEMALASLLVDPHFLFRLERDPANAKPGEAYRLSDLDLASRLSFFLWSSIPDDELLTVATQGKLRDRAVLEQQVRRMLSDNRASGFLNSFFGQWLSYRNVTAARPDPKIFVAFDENLREAFQKETELFLASQVREDRSAVELLTANYTFANERLARHYGIPGVVGAHFRRVTYPDDVRAGLLGQGSILTVTSYADRTSVVLRGKWIMEHLLGTPPPPPPPEVPPLDQTQVKGSLRQRMEIHRKNPVCATCHRSLDPLGFAFENFDGIGGFRKTDTAVPIDASGAFVDGTAFNGPAAFRQVLLSRQEAFLGTLVENLLTYAVGRGMEPHDMPAVRRVVREAKTADYRWSALVTAIVRSMPFQMRSAAS
jgi:hypothetical protein